MILLCALGVILCIGCTGNTETTSTPEVPEENPEPSLSDEGLMDLVQKQTFRYLWDFAEANSGMALERSNGSSITVTIGDSGFGLVSIPVAVEREWITEQQAVQRTQKILNFLEKVPTYHGAFSHWYNGATAETVPFSEQDNGGDLVETSFLMQGLLILRQYFGADTEVQQEIRDRITALWEAVEWGFYTQGQNVLYWHWSPDYNFDIGLPITGYNEALITIRYGCFFTDASHRGRSVSSGLGAEWCH